MANRCALGPVQMIVDQFKLQVVPSQPLRARPGPITTQSARPRTYRAIKLTSVITRHHPNQPNPLLKHKHINIIGGDTGDEAADGVGSDGIAGDFLGA